MQQIVSRQTRRAFKRAEAKRLLNRAKITVRMEVRAAKREDLKAAGRRTLGFLHASFDRQVQKAMLAPQIVGVAHPSMRGKIYPHSSAREAGRNAP